MVETRRPASDRRPQRVNNLLLGEALTTWVPPAIGFALLAGATILDALGIIADASAAFATVFALLLLGVFAVVSPLLDDDRRPKPRPAILTGLAFVWITLYVSPFALRLFPGQPIAGTPVDGRHAGEHLAVGTGRFDVVLDAHLPLTADRQNRQLHYALTLTDGAGAPHRLEGDLGDRWQTRRLGRRGTAPVHLEHLSARYEIDNPAGDALRLDDVTIAGVPEATIGATIYRHRLPSTPWLLGAGILCVLAALCFDLWWNPRRTPTAAFLTATATGATLVFCGSASGHAGVRQVIGALIVGALVGIPATALAAWVVRRSPWTRAITVRDHA